MAATAAGVTKDTEESLTLGITQAQASSKPPFTPLKNTQAATAQSYGTTPATTNNNDDEDDCCDRLCDFVCICLREPKP